MKNIVTAIAALISLTAFSAEAQQRWPNWYVGIHADLAFIPDQDYSVSPGGSGELDFDEGYGAGASIGYMPGGPGFLGNTRFELEYTYVGSEVNGIGTDGDDVRTNAIMLNGFYDFNFGSSIVPYVGAGAGFGGIEIDGINGEEDSDGVFAWQLMAGLGWVPQLSPNTVLSLGYKYVNFDDANFENAGVSTEVEYDSHNIELGARFAF